MDRSIPFNRCEALGNELEEISAALASGQVAGDQTYSKKCQLLLEQSLGTHKALMTTSCTHALEMSAILLDLKPGDEVIVPTFTFVSTANAFALRGAKPVFADIRPDTLNLDEAQLPSLITSRTRAIVPVHYAGIACEMDPINRIATQHELTVIEDNAHGLFGRYRGRYLGTLGHLATQSFHETKNYSCGEGGALLINEQKFAERAEIIREKGTDRSRFFRGQVDKYSWVDLGSSYVMSDLLAAFLFAQLNSRDRIQNRRSKIWHRYQADLASWSHEIGAIQPTVPAHCESAWHMYHLLMPDLETRTRFIAFLKAKGILSVFHYLPLHLSTFAQREWNGQVGDCPVAENASDRLVRLPMYNMLNDNDLDRVIEAVLSFA